MKIIKILCVISFLALYFFTICNTIGIGKNIENQDTRAPAEVGPNADPSYFNALKWRFVRPMGGGRVNAVVGHPTNKNVFYGGYTGGGVWMTPDVGNNWHNLSDGYIKTGSLCAIDISRTNPDILPVGTGEHALRGDVSHGGKGLGHGMLFLDHAQGFLASGILHSQCRIMSQAGKHFFIPF